MFTKALVVTVLAAVAVPATAFARSGVVVKVDRPSALTAVAGAHGSVALVHAKAGAKVGQRVSFEARRLGNGTLAATSMRVTGQAKRVRVRGLVLAHRDGGFVMSANGAALTVHESKQEDAPPVGSSVVVTASVAGGELEQEDARPVLTDARSGAIEGHLVSGAPAGSIAVRSEGLTLVISVPSTIDVSKFMPGDEVLASFQRQADGSLVLTAISGDDQGEVENEDGDDDHGDHHGSSNGSITGTVSGTSSGHSVGGRDGGHDGGGDDD